MFHWQNLTRDDKHGTLPRNGRAWWHLQHHVLRVEWNLLSNRWAAALELDPNENEITVSLCLGLFSLYFGASGMSSLLKKLLPARESRYTPGLFLLDGREISLRFFDGGPWWLLWMDPDESHNTDPWWRRGHIDFRNVLLGRMDYKRTELGPPRWDVRIEKGIPTESDDGIYGLGVPGATLHEAAANVRERVLDSRRRDSGSRDWRPRETAPA